MWERDPLRYSDKPITEYINSEQSSITSQYFLRAKQVLQFVYRQSLVKSLYKLQVKKCCYTHARCAVSSLSDHCAPPHEKAFDIELSVRLWVSIFIILSLSGFSSAILKPKRGCSTGS